MSGVARKIMQAASPKKGNILVVAVDTNLGNTVFGLDTETGDTVWSIISGGNFEGLQILPDGEVFVGQQSSIVNVRDINDGSLIRSGTTADGGGEILAVDSSKNMYRFAFFSTINRTIIRYNSNFTVSQISANLTSNHNDGIAVDGNRNIWACGGVKSTGRRLARINPNGTIQWQISESQSIFNVAVDPSGNSVSVTGVAARGVVKRNSNGSELWSVSGARRGVAYDESEDVWYAGNQKFSQAGSLIVSMNAPASTGVVSDGVGGVYLLNGLGGSTDISKCDASTGNLIWQISIAGPSKNIDVFPGRYTVAGHA